MIFCRRTAREAIKIWGSQFAIRQLGPSNFSSLSLRPYRTFGKLMTYNHFVYGVGVTSLYIYIPFVNIFVFAHSLITPNMWVWSTPNIHFSFEKSITGSYVMLFFFDKVVWSKYGLFNLFFCFWLCFFERLQNFISISLKNVQKKNTCINLKKYINPSLREIWYLYNF